MERAERGEDRERRRVRIRERYEKGLTVKICTCTLGVDDWMIATSSICGRWSGQSEHTNYQWRALDFACHG